MPRPRRRCWSRRRLCCRCGTSERPGRLTATSCAAGPPSARCRGTPSGRWTRGYGRWRPPSTTRRASAGGGPTRRPGRGLRTPRPSSRRRSPRWSSARRRLRPRRLPRRPGGGPVGRHVPRMAGPGPARGQRLRRLSAVTGRPCRAPLVLGPTAPSPGRQQRNESVMTQLTRLSLANRLIVGMVTIAIVVFGVMSTLSLRQELLPSTQVPTAILTATYPGTAPELVADEVATPLEQAISGVSGVTKVRSQSLNGLATLTVEWTYGLDNDEVLGDIRSAADGVAARLPDSVEYEVLAGSTDDIPVLVLGVASDAPLDVLARQVDDTVVPQLSGIEGVRQVQVSGQDVTELVVTLRPAELRRYDVNAAAVTQAVQAQAQVVPAGNSFDKDIELAIQVGRTTTAAKEVAGWWIPAPDGPVQLGTLAAVKVESVEATTIARSDGRPALSVNILKETDADAVEISHQITERLPEIAAGLGQNATIQVVFDQAPSIEQSIEDLAVEGSLGLAFAVLIILVFLQSLRSTIITAISIPLSLMIALIGLQVGGYSLNIFTLAAMTVAVGRVVDDSIVVIENIKRRDTGPNPLSQGDIVASVREVAGAVTASTLTTVAVFLPVAGVSGITGELFPPFSTTMAIALTASLLVSLTIVPVLAYWFLSSAKRSAARAANGRAHDEDDVTRLQRGYLPVLNLVLRRPLISAATALVIFVATVASTGLLKTDFLESFADKTTLQIDQELPLGTRLSTTSDAAAQVEAILAASPGVKEYLTTIGQGGSNRASMFVSLTGEDAYDATLAELESAFAELDDAAGGVEGGGVNTRPPHDPQN